MSSSFPQQLILCCKTKGTSYLIDRSLIKAHHLLNKYCACCWQGNYNKITFITHLEVSHFECCHLYKLLCNMQICINVLSTGLSIHDSRSCQLRGSGMANYSSIRDLCVCLCVMSRHTVMCQRPRKQKRRAAHKCVIYWYRKVAKFSLLYLQNY